MQWNPWHGCRKYSEGCLHCYVYRTDALYGRDSSRVVQTAEFDKPLRRKRDGKFLLAGDEPVFTCFFLRFLSGGGGRLAAGGVADDPRAAGAFVFSSSPSAFCAFRRDCPPTGATATKT